jgi:hypothetical protein
MDAAVSHPPVDPPNTPLLHEAPMPINNNLMFGTQIVSFPGMRQKIKDV